MVHSAWAELFVRSERVPFAKAAWHPEKQAAKGRVEAA